jgi:hypothetical protein
MEDTLILGAQHSPAAVFIYKSDQSATDAWDSVIEIAAQEGAIRGELHDCKVSFLEGLTAWNLSVDPAADSFLCIYSHAGKAGLAPSRRPPLGDVVQWDELADALPRGVRYLWLLGCGTDYSQDVWDARAKPVAHRTLSTLESAYWQPFIRFFAREISTDDIASQNELMDRLNADAPLLASKTTYSTNTNWKPW